MAVEIQVSASTTHSCDPSFSVPKWASTVFVRLPLAEEIDVVNVDELDQLAGPDGKVEINELKVLGRGRVTPEAGG